MILPDVNLLVYAYNTDAPLHQQARGPRHFTILSSFCEAGVLQSTLLTDVHIAALAIDNQAIVHTNDSDFSRFQGRCWTNPLR